MSQPVRLVDLYSPAMVSTTIYGRLFEQHWLSAENPETHPRITQRKKRKRVRADEYFEEHDRVIILGAAGSGKTTLLRHLALSHCDRKIFGTTKLKTSKFPFFIPLLSYAKELKNVGSIQEYITRELRRYTDNYATQFVERILRKGAAILIFDSLDEVPTSSRERVVDDIREICQGYPQCQVVVSCRTADYREFHESFYEVELSRLTKQAVEGIIGVWFAKDPNRGIELVRHLKRDKAVASLCETPLLLSLICIQFRHDLTLPKRKAELFRRCIDAFLREWDAGRGFRRDTAYASLSDDRKERIFESVAGQYFAEDVRYTFPQEDLVNLIGDHCDLYGIPKNQAANVLKELESHHGIIERFSADSFMFSHPSFQEYFAARYLLTRRSEMDALRYHLSDLRWASVIEFIVAMHSDPSQLLEFLASKSNLSNIKNFPTMARRTQTLWMLYRCLISGAAVSGQLRERMYQHIVESHFHMAKAFKNGGVFPVAILMQDGVRHSYVYYRRRRTLHEALRPLRLLANEILLSPTEEYANCVVKRLDEMGKGTLSMSDTATALCLAVPIAKLRPKVVREILKRAKKPANRLFKNMAEETLQVMNQQKLP